ncbi:MAG: 4-diphosphocytidyl-2C-methyl-D-erythritol kinase, partial [Sulfurimonas sp.]|uniref:hypothetical protein n=1 Tax=Sulfurimonas sp. TaxID=2022749 RepID=UPI0039E57282
CPHSKKYITKIIQNKKALEINSYYIFLYKLPKYDSSKLSQHIYKSHTPLKTLQDVMVANNTANVASTELDKKQENILNEITKVAIELKIHIRPYVMRFQKNSSFCTVSSGTAPCMEEYDFE